MNDTIPRPHLFMQSEESRAISNYFHNKLRGSGSCISAPREQQPEQQRNIIAPPVAVIVVAPIVTWRLLLAAPARKFRVPSALAFPILSVPFAPKALFVPISAIPVALLTMSAP